jgi:uncharacterized damage-inducible protein DinB
MNYAHVAIPDDAVPAAADPRYQHAIDTYASETNKVVSVWSEFTNEDLDYRPHAKSASVGEIFKHELLSQRRFFGEFLGLAEPPAPKVLPKEATVESARERLRELAVARLEQLAGQPETWWRQPVPFFDVTRERIWVFWRRILHTAHHRTQLTVYLRLLDKPVPATYGPTADVSWQGADPTRSVESAGRK